MIPVITGSAADTAGTAAAGKMLPVQRLLVIARHPVLPLRWARPPQVSVAAVVGRFKHWGAFPF